MYSEFSSDKMKAKLTNFYSFYKTPIDRHFTIFQDYHFTAPLLSTKINNGMT